MEVQHAGVRLPAFDSLRHAEVIERRRSPKPPGQTLLRSHIVTRKDVQPAQSSQRHVLGGPAADSMELEQLRAYLRVAVEGEGVEIDRALSPFRERAPAERAPSGD